jgi:hypothetical protein
MKPYETPEVIELGHAENVVLGFKDDPAYENQDWPTLRSTPGFVDRDE